MIEENQLQLVQMFMSISHHESLHWAALQPLCHGYRRTANTVELIIPCKGFQYRQLFLSGILMESLAEDACSFVPRGCGLVTLLRIASPALYLWDSEPARRFLGVLPQSFFVVAVKFLTVCLWIWTYSRTKMFHTAANSFLSYFSIHSNWHQPLFQSPVKWTRWC